MPEPVADTLHQYASFIGSSLDHVVVEALKLIFKKDAEFKAWKDQQRTLLPQAETERSSVELARTTTPMLFAERKRDGHRGTGEKAGTRDAKQIAQSRKTRLRIQERPTWKERLHQAALPATWWWEGDG
jgi:hypothetical protein